jgi:hypothetical protein
MSLLRRYQEGAGIGNKFITSKHVYAWTRMRFGVNQERSTEEVNSATLAEVFTQLELNFFRFLQTKDQFGHSTNDLLQSFPKGQIS